MSGTILLNKESKRSSRKSTKEKQSKKYTVSTLQESIDPETPRPSHVPKSSVDSPGMQFSSYETYGTEELVSCVNLNERVHGSLRPKVFRPHSVFMDDGSIARLGPDDLVAESYSRHSRKKTILVRLPDRYTFDSDEHQTDSSYSSNDSISSKTTRTSSNLSTSKTFKKAPNVSDSKKEDSAESSFYLTLTKKATIKTRKSEIHTAMTTIPTEAVTAGRSLHRRSDVLTPRSSACALYSKQYPTPMPPPPFTMSRIGITRNRDNTAATSFDTDIEESLGPIVMANGTIQLRLREDMRVDMTVDKSIRLYNHRCEIAMTMSGHGKSSAIIHPYGRVLQNGSKVDILTYDALGRNNFVRRAKMWYRGISFTSETCALSYLVDSAGVRTINDTFSGLTDDFTLTMFYEKQDQESKNLIKKASDIVAASTYHHAEDNSDFYKINGYHIVQIADGSIKITRGFNKYLMRTSPIDGSCTLDTSNFHVTASMGNNSRLLVRRNEKRIDFDGTVFFVHNAGQSAGFNEDNLFTVQ